MQSCPLTINIETLTANKLKKTNNDYILWLGDTYELLRKLPLTEMFDLVITSPPYNIGKAYEKKQSLDNYLKWQKGIIDEIIPRLKSNGSLCWQVGNYVENGSILPLDIELAPLFKSHNLQLRNRIIWHFGHGLHNKNRFSGRYEVILWYTKSSNYTFNLDSVRIPSKYPGKRYFKGIKAGQISGNPLGKNPEDVWDIPNVKANHIEKTDHPCQFPVGLIERLVLALSNKDDLIFDPFSGVGSTGVACAIHGRKYWGSELDFHYTTIASSRILEALKGDAQYRPHDTPIYDHTKSKLSRKPQEWTQGGDE